MKNIAYNLDTLENTSMKSLVPELLKGNDQVVEISEKILAEIMKYRRLPRKEKLCGDSKCSTCSTIHLPKIISAVRNQKPVTFVLPAFPGKSPNTNKVLGYMPDFAEKLSLSFLGDLCERVKNFYAPGIKIIICSDGRVFSDVVGMQESHVTSYQIELDKLIDEMSLKDISTFNLDHVYKDLSFNQMRDELMKTYSKLSEFLKHKIRSGAKSGATSEEVEANRMYRGITRFLFEDSLFPGQKKSRAAIQRDAKSRAYEVIRRSNAWSDLIEELFPEAVRLSIHPQACGSKKLGIRLVGNESWMTPWHGVAMKTPEGHILVKRSEAEELGAKLIYDSLGRPSHYQLFNASFEANIESKI